MQRTANWLTPLHYACRKNYDVVAATLIEHEANIECRDKTWVTPLHVCAANNSLECAELFVERISNINVSDRSGATALHHAAFNGNCDMITFLLKKGCEPNAFDKKSAGHFTMLLPSTTRTRSASCWKPGPRSMLTTRALRLRSTSPPLPDL